MARNKSKSPSPSPSQPRAHTSAEDHVSLRYAGLALAGASVLALVSSAAGRRFIRSTATSVARVATENFDEMFGASIQKQPQKQTLTPARQKPSGQRIQDRV